MALGGFDFWGCEGSEEEGGGEEMDLGLEDRLGVLGRVYFVVIRVWYEVSRGLMLDREC